MNILLEYDLPFFNFSSVYEGIWAILLCLFVTAAIIAAIICVVSLARSGSKFVFTTQDLTYAAICLALSYALSYFGFSLPMGGTVTPASILPVAVFCYFFGFRKGAIVSAVYMLLQLTQQPYIVSAWSMVLDYIVPYFALSIIGIFSYKPNSENANKSGFALIASHWRFFVGLVIYVLVRYASHVASGVVFYGEWAVGDPLLYSLAYNSFCLVDMLIACLGAWFVLGSKAFNKTLIDAVNHSNEVTKRTN